MLSAFKHHPLDSNFFEELFEIGELHQNPDGPRNRSGIRHDEIRGAGNVITPGGGYRAHGGNDFFL